MQLTSSIYLPGLCEEAVAFYRSALNAELLSVQRIEDSIDPRFIQPGTEKKILRAVLKIGQSLLYLSDGHANTEPGHRGFSLSLGASTQPEAERLIAALSEGGRILLPLRQTSWAGLYSVVVDRFGLHWTVDTSGIAA